MPLKDFHTRKIFVKVRRKSKISDCLRTQNGGENLPGKEIDNYRMKNCLNIFSRSVVVVVVVVVVVSDVGRKDKIKIRSFFIKIFNIACCCYCCCCYCWCIFWKFQSISFPGARTMIENKILELMEEILS